MTEAIPLVRQRGMRELIRESWPERHGGLGTRKKAEPPGRGAPGLKQRLFQRVLGDLEAMSRRGLDRNRIRRVVEESPEAATLSDASIDRLVQELVDETEGLGMLGPLLRDPTVSDVLVNGTNEVWVDRFGKLERTSISFDDDSHVRRLLGRLVAQRGRRLDDASPYVDVRLADGSRLNAVLPPVSLRGPIVSIRRVRPTPFAIEELIAFGTLSREMADLLRTCVARRKNIVISGGAGAGKTTLLNVLSRSIPDEQRVVTIEETAELRLEHPHVIPLETRLPNIEGHGAVGLRELVKNALRMRADRIIVGEVRGAEAFEMIQAMHVGHDGSMTTVHGSSPRDALRRLESLMLMGGGDLPERTVKELLSSVVHIVVQLTRFADGARRITSIGEAVISEEGSLDIQELFRFSSRERRFQAMGAMVNFRDRLAREFEEEHN